MTAFLATAWGLLGQDPDVLARVVDRSDEVRALLPSPLPVGSLAHDTVAAASLLASAARTGRLPARLTLDPARIATAYTSERHYRLDGARMSAWAPLSGFWQCRTGWLRTHANYDWHRRRLLGAVGLADDAGPDDFRKRLRELDATDAEAAIVGADGVAALVRTPEEWAATDQSRAVAAQPLLRRERIGEAPPARREPVDGVRVLDLTRVIAGPVATRTLSLLGADVLRVDPPALPEPPWQHLDTGMGKRSALLDLRSRDGAERFAELLAGADVVATGYRPGALDRLGLDPAALAARRPGLVVARLSAWGTAGPWGGRRGFDSIVQAASGIAVRSGSDGRPGALPAQALDHSAGYLLAAGILSALAERATVGGSWLVETSLARIAGELLAAPAGEPVGAAPLEPTTLTRETPSGSLRYAAPALAGPGVPADWTAAGDGWGTAEPAWR